MEEFLGICRQYLLPKSLPRVGWQQQWQWGHKVESHVTYMISVCSVAFALKATLASLRCINKHTQGFVLNKNGNELHIEPIDLISKD